MNYIENCKVAILGKAYLVRSALELIISRLNLTSVSAENACDLPPDIGVVLVSLTKSQDIQAEINACLDHFDTPRIVLLPQDHDLLDDLTDLPSEVAAIVPPGMEGGEIESVILLVADGHRIVRFTPADNRVSQKEFDVPDHLHGLLTKRQIEILKELAKGQTNKGIARSLNISINTVEAHVSSIIRKLNVENRTQAALVLRGGLQCRSNTGRQRNHPLINSRKGLSSLVISEAAAKPKIHRSSFGNRVLIGANLRDTIKPN